MSKNIQSTFTRTKICGITRLSDALVAVDAGVWALGFIFYKKSPRSISSTNAKKIIHQLPPFVTPVGVFVNEKEEKVKKICRDCGISTVQFHGDESPTYCRRFKGFKIIKAIRVKPDLNWKKLSQYPVDVFLFDTFKAGQEGGTGDVFNWDLLKSKSFKQKVILSGGLNPQNVASAIKALHPFAVDCASGVEKSPGIKDPALIRHFIQNIHA